MLRLFGSLLLSLLSPSVLACDCLWQGPFKAVYDNADLLAHVRVEATKGNSADLTLLETLSGKSTARAFACGQTLASSAARKSGSSARAASG